MKLPLFWKAVLGFGVIVIAILILHGYAVTRIEDSYATAVASVASNADAIRAAHKLHTLLDAEERCTRLFLAIRDNKYALLRAEAHRMSCIQIDSLALFLHADGLRSSLAAVRRTHESTASTIAKAPRGASPISPAYADSMRDLHSRLDQIIRSNEEAIGTLLASVEEDTSTAAEWNFWLLLAGIVGSIGGAFFVTRWMTSSIVRLRYATERIAHGGRPRPPRGATEEITALAQAIDALSARLTLAEQAKAEFAQQLAQTLSTPLKAIHACYYVLAEQIAGPMNERQMALVTNIRDNVDLMTAFSNDFLDLAKIEAGMMRYNKQVVDLLTLVTPLINAARVAATPKGINIGLAVQSVPVVRVDPDKVTTVLNTLLNNAVRTSPMGGSVTVSITPSGNGARISVKDSGRGIAREDIPKVFSKYVGTRNASPDARGTGVSLALVKAIVDDHGGRIYATSVTGEGSTFTVELPAQNVQPLPHPPQPN